MQTDLESYILRKIAKLREEARFLQAVLEEFRSPQPLMLGGPEYVDSAVFLKPAEAIRVILCTKPNKRWSARELREEIEEMREAGVLDAKPNRTSRDIVHSVLPALIRRGEVVKETEPDGSSCYIHVDDEIPESDDELPF